MPLGQSGKEIFKEHQIQPPAPMAMTASAKRALSYLKKEPFSPSYQISKSTKLHYLNSKNQNWNRVYSCLGGKEVRSNTLVALEYADLNLTPNLSGDLGGLRIRQHVNPLKPAYSVPAEVPDWTEVYRDPKLPLMVDIGSGSGRFLMLLAKRNADSGNYLGLEIRQKLVKRAVHWVKELALDNVHFMFGNATLSFDQLVRTYPGPLILVSVLCPDPHCKTKHHKRRVLQKPLVDSIIKNLVPGGKVFVQSDVLEVAVDMRDKFDANSATLQHIDEVDQSVLCDHDGWLLSNPMGIRTEREIHAELEGAKIYRRFYQKRT